MLLTVPPRPLVFSSQILSSMVRETGVIHPVLSHDHNRVAQVLVSVGKASPAVKMRDWTKKLEGAQLQPRVL